MFKHLYTLISDFVILILAASALFFFKSLIIQEGVWLYELAWVVIIIATIGTLLLKPRKTKVMPLFPRVNAKRIENALPHEAIKLYQSWLLMSLDQCYQPLKKKHSEEKLSDLVTVLTDNLVFIFNRVPEESLYKILEERNKDNAFVALLFFTTVIKTLEPYAVKSLFKKPVSAYRDVFTQITLEKAPGFLFREHYRLYDLGALVKGQWVSLNFNSDIEQLLRSVLAPQLLENKSAIKTKKIASTKVNESADIESKGIVSKSQEDSVSKQIDKKPVVAQEAVVEIELQNPVSADDIEIEQCKKFFKWLQRQVQRKPINKSPYFYQDCTQYGESMLFITECALADFSKKTQILASEIKKALMSLNHSDGKSYQLKEKGNLNKKLLSTVVDFEIKGSSKLKGIIEKVL